MECGLWFDNVLEFAVLLNQVDSVLRLRDLLIRVRSSPLINYLHIHRPDVHYQVLVAFVRRLLIYHMCIEVVEQ